MRYLLGDSTESKLDFNYLSFLREVVDCAVVLLEAEGTLNANVERRNTKTSEWAGLIRAVEELGKEAAALVEPIVKEQPKTPVGKCAAAIAKAVKDAVDHETAAAKTQATAARDEVDREDSGVRTKARTTLEKLLRAHDLPGAEKELEAQWTGGGVKAKMRQRTPFGVEAGIQLETQSSAVLVSDLRVERIAEGVEVNAHEAGGWLKKGDKLVSQKLGRYQVIAAGVTTRQVRVQLRSAPDANAVTLAITAKRTGEITIEGSAGKEYEVDERQRGGLKQLVDKLEAALHEIEDQRMGLLELSIDGKAFAEHGHPRVLAEKLIAAVAPTVQVIARHSRSPGELVLRRQLADDRREEVFISISELTRKMDVLPIEARAVFGPLQLGVDLSTGPVAAPILPTPTPAPTPSPLESRPSASRPPENKAFEPRVEAKMVVDARPPERPTPDPRPMQSVLSRTGKTIPPPPARTPPEPPASSSEEEAKLAASIDAALAEDDGALPPD